MQILGNADTAVSMSLKRRDIDTGTSKGVKRRKSNEVPLGAEGPQTIRSDGGGNNAHIRFDSEEPSPLEDERASLVEEAAGVEVLEANDSSEDEAPEAVQTNDAQVSMLAAAAEARRVAER